MKKLGFFLLVLVGLNLIGNILLPGSFTHPLYDRNPEISTEFIDRINGYKPDLFIVGNSLVARGIDILRLEELTGLRILSADRGGSASALWYLILKNNIVVANPPPRYIVFVFKDNVFSVPSLSTQGKYATEIDEFAGADEVALNQLAYINHLSPLDNALNSISAFYRYRGQIRERLVNAVEYPPNQALFGVDINGISAAIDRVFQLEELDPAIVSQYQQQVDQEALLLSRNLDFYASLSESFLPLILDLAEQNGITPIFVLYPARHYVEYPGEKLEMHRYFADMSEYVRSRGAYFVSFIEDERIGLNEFAEGDHLNGKGNLVFTEMMAEELNQIIQQ